MVKTVTKPRSVVGDVRDALERERWQPLQSSVIVINNNILYWTTFQNFLTSRIGDARSYWGNL